MADTPKHSVSVAGIVVDDQDRVLIIQRRDNGKWEPPGGVLELNETPEEGVRREVQEETGILVDVLSLTGAYKNMAQSVVALVFRCEVIAGEPETGTESSKVRWATLEEIERMMVPAYSVRVRDALTYNTTAAVRVHNGVDII